MAKLSQEQLSKIITQAGKHPDIEFAVQEEARAKFHTEAVLASSIGSSSTTSGAAKIFLEWVRNLIDASKYKIFQHLLTNPVATIDVSESIFNEVRKVFEGQDRFVGYQFVNEQQRTDFELYLKKICDDTFWRTSGMTAIKNGYNSIVVVDLPDEEDDEDVNPDMPGVVLQPRPEPYYYLLPIGKLYWIDIDPLERDIEWIFFEDCENKDRAYIFDDVFYRSYNRDDKALWVLDTEVAHNLGYVPAKQFWGTNLSSDSQIRKQGLISNSLGNYDKLLFKMVSQTHVDLYALYPIVTMYSQKCDYTDGEGNSCEGGKVRSLMKDGIGGIGSRETFQTCPKCEGGVGSLGAGAVFEAPAPKKSDDPNLIDAIKFVSSDIENLKWIAEDVSTMKNEMTYSIIGVTDEINGVAINKDQVASQYESRQNVLMYVKNQMEDIHKWTHETMAKLRYGKAFVSCTVNYGTRFFIQTAAQLMKEYLDARTGGIPVYELANQRNQIYETKYRSNPEMLQRVRILSQIEPYQDYSIEQIKDLISIGNLFDVRLLAFKVDFTNYVNQFEREYTDVNTFMQNEDFSTKITVMRELMLEYVDLAIVDQKASAPPPPAPPVIVAPGSPPIGAPATTPPIV